MCIFWLPSIRNNWKPCAIYLNRPSDLQSGMPSMLGHLTSNHVSEEVYQWHYNPSIKKLKFEISMSLIQLLKFPFYVNRVAKSADLMCLCRQYRSNGVSEKLTYPVIDLATPELHPPPQTESKWALSFHQYIPVRPEVNILNDIVTPLSCCP